MSPQKRKSRRDDFMFWWPVIARMSGLIIGTLEAMLALITHQSADPGVIAFCGALVAAPFIFGAQDKRNNKDEGES